MRRLRTHAQSCRPPGTFAVPFSMRSFQLSNGLPRVSSTIVMQPGTGQTCEQRLQPMHSSQSTQVTFTPDPAARAIAASRVGARCPSGSGWLPV